MTNNDDSTRTRVNIIRLEPVQSGSRDGAPWTKYAVTATTPDGRPLPVDKPIFTFDALGTGEQDVLILPYTQRSTGHVVSYTMKRPKTKKSGGSTNEDTVPRAEFEKLKARVKALEALYESIPSGATRP